MRKSAAAAGLAGIAALTMAAGMPQANAATFGASVLVSSFNSTEPGLDVAPDGTLYISAPRGLPSLSSLWRSTDGGANWTLTPATTRAGAIGGGDSDVAVHPDGKLAWTDLSLASAGVGTSTDKGNTWLAQPFSAPLQDRQWVQVGGGGTAYHLTHQLEGGLLVSKSFDGGLTYEQHVLAVHALTQVCLCPPGYFVVQPGTGLLGSNDKIGLTWSTGSGVRYARSENGGLTWTTSTITSGSIGETMNSFPVVARAGTDKLVAVWQEQSNSATRIGFSKSTNFGATWSSPQYIVTGGSAVFPWVDARGDKVSVALYHSSSFTGNPNNAPASAQWFVKYLESTNFGVSWSTMTAVESTPAKTGKVCTDGLGCSSGRELGDFFQVTLDNAGKANIAYVRVGNGIRFIKEL